METAKLPARVPGGHPLIADHLRDHLRPAGGLVVGSQRKGRDVAAAVTLDAPLLENVDDAVGIGDRRIRLGRPHPTDQAAHGVCPRRGHALAGQQLVERLGQLVPPRLFPDKAHAVLVVDAARIADRAVAIEHEHLGRAGGAELIRHAVAGILEDGKLDAVRPGVGGDFREGVVHVGIDRHERHALRAVCLMQPRQPGAVELCQGALGAQEGDHDKLLIGKVIERMLLASNVFERETGDWRCVRTGATDRC